jgi:predicted small lipoprotein YifL
LVLFGSLKMSRVALLAAAALIALLSAGCGRRGDLEPPDASAPQSSATATQPNATATHAANDRHSLQLHRSTQTITPPKKDFVLDPLLH